MKHTKETTLFGCFAPADRVVYANPARLYEKFVNAFVAASSKSKKEAVDEANKAWPSYRDDRDKLTKFFDKPTGPTDKNGKPLDFGFRQEVIDGEAPKGNEGVSRSAPSATSTNDVHSVRWTTCSPSQRSRQSKSPATKWQFRLALTV